MTELDDDSDLTLDDEKDVSAERRSSAGRRSSGGRRGSGRVVSVADISPIANLAESHHPSTVMSDSVNTSSSPLFASDAAISCEPSALQPSTGEIQPIVAVNSDPPAEKMDTPGPDGLVLLAKAAQQIEQFDDEFLDLSDEEVGPPPAHPNDTYSDLLNETDDDDEECLNVLPGVSAQTTDHILKVDKEYLVERSAKLQELQSAQKPNSMTAQPSHLATLGETDKADGDANVCVQTHLPLTSIDTPTKVIQCQPSQIKEKLQNATKLSESSCLATPSLPIQPQHAASSPDKASPSSSRRQSGKAPITTEEKSKLHVLKRQKAREIRTLLSNLQRIVPLSPESLGSNASDIQMDTSSHSNSGSKADLGDFLAIIKQLSVLSKQFETSEESDKHDISKAPKVDPSPLPKTSIATPPVGSSKPTAPPSSASFAQIQKIKNVGHRLYAKGLKAQTRRQEWVERQLQEQSQAESQTTKDSCTFTPTISPYAQQLDPAVLRNHTARTAQKWANLSGQLKNLDIQSCTFRPELCPNSKEIIHQKIGDTAQPDKTKPKATAHPADDETAKSLHGTSIEKRARSAEPRSRCSTETCTRLAYSKVTTQSTIEGLRAVIDNLRQSHTMFRPHTRSPPRPPVGAGGVVSAPSPQNNASMNDSGIKSVSEHGPRRHPPIHQELHNERKELDEKRMELQRKADADARAASDVRGYIGETTERITQDVRNSRMAAVFEALDQKRTGMISLTDLYALLHAAGVGTICLPHVQLTDTLTVPLGSVLIDILPVLEQTGRTHFSAKAFTSILSRYLIYSRGPSSLFHSPCKACHPLNGRVYRRAASADGRASSPNALGPHSQDAQPRNTMAFVKPGPGVPGMRNSGEIKITRYPTPPPPAASTKKERKAHQQKKCTELMRKGDAEDRHQQLMKLKDEAIRQEMKECTFKPQVHGLPSKPKSKPVTTDNVIVGKHQIPSAGPYIIPVDITAQQPQHPAVPTATAGAADLQSAIDDSPVGKGGENEFSPMAVASELSGSSPNASPPPVREAAPPPPARNMGQHPGQDIAKQNPKNVKIVKPKPKPKPAPRPLPPRPVRPKALQESRPFLSSESSEMALIMDSELAVPQCPFSPNNPDPASVRSHHHHHHHEDGLGSLCAGHSTTTITMTGFDIRQFGARLMKKQLQESALLEKLSAAPAASAAPSL